MNKKLINVLVFATGAAIGSGVTWYITKTRYERILQEEIESVKDTWARMNQKDSDEDTIGDDDTEELIEDEDEEEYPDADDFDESDRIDYSSIASLYKPSGEKACTEDDGKGDGDNDLGFPYINGPYVITPNDFADGDFDHDKYCLTYYADGVLADDWWKVLDIEGTIGEESLEHFGEHAEDILHVRNERLRADYEIVRDDRRYADLVANDPLLKSAYED